MMDLLMPEMMPELLSIKGNIFISLYMPTFKSHPENQLGATKFKQLVKELEASLLLKLPCFRNTILVTSISKPARLKLGI